MRPRRALDLVFTAAVASVTAMAAGAACSSFGNDAESTPSDATVEGATDVVGTDGTAEASSPTADAADAAADNQIVSDDFESATCAGWSGAAGGVVFPTKPGAGSPNACLFCASSSLSYARRTFFRRGAGSYDVQMQIASRDAGPDARWEITLQMVQKPNGALLYEHESYGLLSASYAPAQLSKLVLHDAGGTVSAIDLAFRNGDVGCIAFDDVTLTHLPQ